MIATKRRTFTLTCIACCRDYEDTASRRQLSFCPDCTNEVTVWTKAERAEYKRWRKCLKGGP